MESGKATHPKKRVFPAAAHQSAQSQSGFSLSPPVQKKPNETGLPDQLKDGVELLSGYSLDDVNVHYNSSKPVQLNAHAYAQGTDIHLGPGQEKHLPHEAWHVVQQKQGRVEPTFQMRGKVNVNNEAGLEREADLMGARAGNLNFTNINSTDDKAVNFNTAESIAIQKINIHKNFAPGPVIQRIVNLNEKYADLIYDDKDFWLDKFKRVQEILNDQALVDEHLKNLSNLMIQKGKSLSAVLKEYEGRTFSKEDTLLTDFVPSDVFLSLIREGRLFEDLVGKTHGVQSHRIQWSVIKSALGCAETELIFKEAGNQRWILSNGKTMWDNIVDGIKSPVNSATDFTIPDNLEKYVYDKYQHFYFFEKKRNDPLIYDLHETHDAMDERKVTIKQRYPGRDDFPNYWIEIEKNHRDAKNSLGSVAYAKYKTENAHLFKHEVIEKTSTVDDITQTIEWTGWILNEDSQHPMPEGPFFVPTVGKIINRVTDQD